MIQLIITADDFGYTKLFNKMILELIREGSITSTSVMIDEIDESQKEQLKELIQLSKDQRVSTGLHMYFKNTDFQKEIERQFSEFVDIFGFEPSHVDIHKPDYLKDAYPIIQEFCKRKRIPCKNLSKYKEVDMNLSGDLITTRDSSFDGTEKSFTEISEWLSGLNDGLHVITFHPGYYDPDSHSSLNKQRELDAQNAREVKRHLPDYKIEPANFHDLKTL